MPTFQNNLIQFHAVLLALTIHNITSPQQSVIITYEYLHYYMYYSLYI